MNQRTVLGFFAVAAMGSGGAGLAIAGGCSDDGATDAAAGTDSAASTTSTTSTAGTGTGGAGSGQRGCGDGTCEEEGESCDVCPEDCGPCPACGDAICESAGGWEGCDSCPEDCGACGTCGDATCDAESGEDCATCADDCGLCPGCDDGVCDAVANETCASCPLDCGACDACGDGTCEDGETCSTCEEDCGRCDPCGDGECDPDAAEDCATCPGDCAACDVREGCVQGDYEPFWGNLHAHTHYSDGERTPAFAFAHARDAGLDFMWISDHREGLTPTEWSACKEQANEANENGGFVAGCGYEMTIMAADGSDTKLGHLNRLFSGTLQPKPLGLEALYDDLRDCDPCVGQWNHPPGPGTFRDYKLFAAGKGAMRLMELNGKAAWEERFGAFFMALENGWTVSPAWNEDNHSETWGDSGHATGVWARELGRLAVRNAVRARRTFAAGDDTATIRMTADEACWMGSILRGDGPSLIAVELADAQADDGFGKVQLFGPGQVVLGEHACQGANPCTATFPIDVTEATFVVAHARQQDGDRIVSAPIWFEP